MWASFFAVGPAFNRNFTIDWDIENIDLYSLMAAVLHLKPAPNDGNFTRVNPLLKDHHLATPEPKSVQLQAKSTKGTATIKVQILVNLLTLIVLSFHKF